MSDDEDADAADTWWDTLPPRRRSQIHRWIVSPDQTTPQIPGQLDLLEPPKEEP